MLFPLDRGSSKWKVKGAFKENSKNIFEQSELLFATGEFHRVCSRNYEFCQLRIKGFAEDGCRAIALVDGDNTNFVPLFWTQFLSVFKDGFLKSTLVFFDFVPGYPSKTGCADDTGRCCFHGTAFVWSHHVFGLLGPLFGQFCQLWSRKSLVAARSL